MKRRLFLLLLCLQTSFLALAQEISIQNTNATSLKWYKVTTPNFRVLYPKGFDKQALRVANTLEFIHDPEAVSMGVKPKPISVLLQSQSSISNGFVTLSPRRSEFYTMPPQNYNFIGTNDWLSLLSSHEYRHVVQYQRSIVGFNKFVYYALGQNALSLVAFTAAPQWFWEGDAVATETAFTKSGRGRIPEFNMLFRTNLMEGRTFNYQKQYVRSYKHNIPDHYVLGYHMITYLRNKTNDADIWDKVATRAWSKPYIPFTFSHAVKKETGRNLNKLYREMADSLRTGWQKQIDALELTKFETITTKRPKAYLDYLYPQQMEDGSIAAVITGIGQISTVVKIDPATGNIQDKFVLGPYNDAGMLSVAKGKVTWNEYRYDPRWLVKNYSVVKGYDFDNNKQKDVSVHSRYGGAAISADGTKIVTVESTTDYLVRLVVLDYQSGNVLKTFPNPDNQMILMARWTPDGKSIVAVTLSKTGKKITLFDYETGDIKDLVDVGNENIGHPVMTGDNRYVLYNSPYSGIDNIYAVELSTGKRFQVTASKYGAFNPSLTIDGKYILYNDQARDGLNIVKAPYDPSQWKDLSEVQVPSTHFYDKLVSQESHPDIMKDIPEKSFPTTKYSKARSLVNIHSWGPFFESDVTQADIGISSRDLLGTTVINAGYLFDINERTGTYHAGVSYQGLFPVLDFNYLGGKREVKTSAFDKDVKFNWDETTINGGVRIPLLLTRSKYNMSLTLKNWVGVTKVSNFENLVTKDGKFYAQNTGRFVRVADTLRFRYNTQLSNGTLVYNQASLSFQRYLKQSRRDFNPKWAQLLDLELYNTPFGGDFKGKLAAARTSFYFPGVARHHSILIRGGYQVGMETNFQATNQYSFRNRVFRPRGFSYPFDQQFRSVSFNYAAPIWYPDVQLGPMLNIQRLRANVFYDFGQAVGKNYYYADSGRVYQSTNDRDYHSVGAEFTVDVNVMRLLPQLDLGLRTTYINPDGKYQGKLVIEFVLGTLNL